MEATYTIKDLEQLTGIKAHTIRIWEQRYKILKPVRNENNVRCYCSEDLKLMLNISLLNNNGYKISKIAGMPMDELMEKVMDTIEGNTDFTDQIGALTIAMIDFDEGRFEKIISSNILKLGFEKAIIQVVFPFLMRVGFLWQTGSISPSQEHFISNLIRQKLVVAIDSLYDAPGKNSQTFILFLPKGEMHEISLLFSSYIIKSKGHRVIYLGQNLPIVDLEKACEKHYPDFLLTVFTALSDVERIQKYLSYLGNKYENSEIWVSGYQVIGQDLDLSNNITVIPSINNLIQMVEKIKAL